MLAARQTLLYVASAAFAPALAAGRTTVIATEGEPASGGIFETIFTPHLNDAGQIAFGANLWPGPSGIFRGDSGGTARLAGDGAAVAPDGGYGRVEFIGFNNRGEVALRDVTPNASRPFDIYVTDGSRLTPLVLDDPAGYTGFNPYGGSLNNAGQVQFTATAPDGNGGRAGGLFRADADGITAIARTGQPLPGGGVVASVNRVGALNDAGQLAFEAIDDAGNEVLLAGDGPTLDELARQGQPAPSGGTFTRFDDPVINGTGRVAFSARLEVDGRVRTALFAHDPTSGLRLVTQGGEPASGSSTFSWFGEPSIDDDGRVGFFAQTSAGGGLFSSTADGSISTAATEGQPLPNGGHINDLSRDAPAMLPNGSIVFEANYNGTTSGLADDEDLILAARPDGNLVQIARTGDPLLGSTIRFIDFDPEVGTNAAGQVAYSFRLTDGRYGAAIWTPDLLGDANGDGAVTIADFAVLRANFGAAGEFAQGDFDGDGLVDDRRLRRLAGQFWSWRHGRRPRRRRRLGRDRPRAGGAGRFWPPAGCCWAGGGATRCVSGGAAG